MKSKKLFCLALIGSIWFGSLAPLSRAQNQVAPRGLYFRLAERPTQNEKREPVKPFVTSLSEGETNAILKRLPPIAADEETDKTNFSARSKTIPPPRTGSVIPIKFPADASGKTPGVDPKNAAVLEIVRFAPEGKSALVSDLSVTFSQPMIAVASQAQASENVPVELSPAVKGRWRWLGTTTLIFDAESRFPMATRYSARIPADTRSTSGAPLGRDFVWNFETPAPKIERFYPDGKNYQTLEPDAVMTTSFNQEIDEEKILPKIRMTANGEPVQIRLVTREVGEFHTAVRQLGTVKPKRWLAFRPVESVPLDAEIKVVFEKGLPSAEGSLTSDEAQEFSFKNYGAFRFVKSYCGYYQDPKKEQCDPSDVFKIEFNNQLFSAPLTDALIKIEPPLENAGVAAYGNAIIIQGKKKPRTTYQVTVEPQLQDYYRQTLGSGIKAVFNVGPERPQFFAQGDGLITLDPHLKRKFSVYSRNHAELRVRLYKVSPGDWDTFRRGLDLREIPEKDRRPIPGKLVFDQTIAPGGEPDQLTETRIDLASALENNFGQMIIIAEPTTRPKEPDYYYQSENHPVIRWLQATDIGLDAFVDNENMTALVTDLKTGKPFSGAEVSLHGGESVAADAGGLAVLDLPPARFDLPQPKFANLLVAKLGDDTAILPENTDYRNWHRKPYHESLRWNVFDDRGMYRPNEEVSVKGYVRGVTGGKFADLAEFAGAGREVFYKVNDARQNEILKGQTRLNGFGAFDFKFKLPDNLNLGNASVTFGFDRDAGYFSHQFQVQEFRRPEFEVSVKTETEAPFFVGNPIALEMEAKYYAGGFLASAPTLWTVYAVQTNYTPPNRDDFNFGTFHPWWGHEILPAYSYTQNFNGKTDADGKHRLTVDPVSAHPARPYTLTASPRVQDVNRQAVAGSTGLLIHPGELYVGLRTPKSFVRRGDAFRVETITTDLDGKAVADRDVTVKAVLSDWRLVGGSWRKVELDTQSCQIKSTDAAAACEFRAQEGGVFEITASVSDDRERPNESEVEVWVEGAQTAPKRSVEKESVLLIPDKKEYAPGDVAEILVNAPFTPAEGVLTLRRNGIVKTERFTIDGNSTILQIPIEEKYLPNIHAQFDLVGSSERTNDQGEIDKSLPPRPAFASGTLNLKISTASRRLNVTAEPVEKTLEPGAATRVNVEVKDEAGAPVADAEVALVAVDESVLALSNYSIKNPLDAFYTDFYAGVLDYHSRAQVLLGNPDDRAISARQIENLPVSQRKINALGAASVNITMDGADAKREQVYKNWSKNDVTHFITAEEKQSIKIRQNFNALAIFAPSVTTDAEGRATVDFKLPDNLTRYRVTAVAVTKSKQFGKAESNITAKKSLQMRPSAPRFMNFGDRAEIPVVIQNQTEKPLTVDVAIRASNARLIEGSGKRVEVPANERAEIRFPAVTDRSGTARFQIGAVSGALSDAAEIALPVWTPATTESFATYGTTDQAGAIVQQIEAPRDVFNDFGGLEVTTSSTQLQELTDAFGYLQTYPFSCTEQVASRILSVAALRDVLQAFEAKDLPPKEKIEERMTDDIAYLQQMQHYDGGFSFWRSDDESVPFVSVHVAHALARAESKGYQVPKATLERAKNYLDGIEGKLPETYSQEAKWTIRAYALYVLNLLKDNEADRARSLVETATLEKLSPEAIGWILSVLVDDQDDPDSIREVEQIKRHLLNRTTETAGAAHFVTRYKDGEYVLLSSRRRADGVVLEGLLKASEADQAAGGKYDHDEDENTPPVARQTISELAPKIVRGLLANRTKGRWENTQENVFVLLALDKYFHTFESVTPNFVARIWLGRKFAGEQKFVGRSVDSRLLNVPMNYLQKQDRASNLILEKEGAGRIYYRIGLNYAPKNLKLEAADYGFIVNRRYVGIDNRDDVRENADGSWTIRAGARVRVQLQMIAPTRRYHVALVDKLPAGLEIINAALATTEVVPWESVDYSSNGRDYYKGRGWFEHQNFRDERAEAFTSLLWEGVWSYSYAARATTPGTFVVPPAKAEEMYAPETFGRSKTDLVKVE